MKRFRIALIQTRFKKPIARGLIGVILSWSLLVSGVDASPLYVVADRLNVRSEGFYGARILRTIDGWSDVTPLESLDNGWKKVLLSDGLVGYVNGFYVSDRMPMERVSRNVHAVSVDRAFIRSDWLSKMWTLREGDSLHLMNDRVFSKNWLWVRVLDSAEKLHDNRTGYISKNIVKADNDWISEEAPTLLAEGGWIADSSLWKLAAASQ